MPQQHRSFCSPVIRAWSCPGSRVISFPAGFMSLFIAVDMSPPHGEHYVRVFLFIIAVQICVCVMTGAIQGANGNCLHNWARYQINHVVAQEIPS